MMRATAFGRARSVAVRRSSISAVTAATLLVVLPHAFIIGRERDPVRPWILRHGRPGSPFRVRAR